MSETAIRLLAFLSFFLVFTALERLVPWRVPRRDRTRRWITNLSLTILDTLTLRALAVVMPALAVGAAADAAKQGWGLLNHLELPAAWAGLLSILFLDLAIWAQHLVTHKIPPLWRLHRVHHCDPDFDVTTAVRFHPIEIALSMALKVSLVYLIGPPVWSVIAFEVLLNGTALFNHANFRLPSRLERALRWLIVTPDMHRIHHSAKRADHDRNFGFALSVWDRLFGTYRATPADGYAAMTTGLEWQDDRPTRLGWSLILPFLSRK